MTNLKNKKRKMSLAIMGFMAEHPRLAVSAVAMGLVIYTIISLGSMIGNAHDAFAVKPVEGERIGNVPCCYTPPIGDYPTPTTSNLA